MDIVAIVDMKKKNYPESLNDWTGCCIIIIPNLYTSEPLVKRNNGENLLIIRFKVL